MHNLCYHGLAEIPILSYLVTGFRLHLKPTHLVHNIFDVTGIRNLLPFSSSLPIRRVFLCSSSSSTFILANDQYQSLKISVYNLDLLCLKVNEKSWANRQHLFQPLPFYDSMIFSHLQDSIHTVPPALFLYSHK